MAKLNKLLFMFLIFLSVSCENPLADQQGSLLADGDTSEVLDLQLVTGLSFSATALSVSVNSVTLSWVNPNSSDSGFSTYEVSYSTSNTVEPTSGWTVIAGTTSQDVTAAPTACTGYYAWLRAKDVEGNVSDGVVSSNTITDDQIAPTVTGAPVVTTINGLLTQSNTVDWATMTLSDNCAVTDMYIAIGTTAGAVNTVAYTSLETNVSAFDVTSTTNYQVVNGADSFSISLTSGSTYYTSLKIYDAVGNESTVATSAVWSLARTCQDLISATPGLANADAVYSINPDGLGNISVFCNMTYDNGGWTLITNRSGATVNVEACGADLNDFFQNTCGVVTSITYADSYNFGDATERAKFLTLGADEWLFVQTDFGGTDDTDDSYIIHAGFDLFPNSIGVVHKTLVTKICDISNVNCDSTDVNFMWAGDGFWASANCNSSYSSGFRGNYGYCENGVTSTYSSNGLFGNRKQYSETKLWNHNNTAKDYQERIFMR